MLLLLILGILIAIALPVVAMEMLAFEDRRGWPNALTGIEFMIPFYAILFSAAILGYGWFSWGKLPLLGFIPLIAVPVTYFAYQYQVWKATRAR